MKNLWSTLFNAWSRKKKYGGLLEYFSLEEIYKLDFYEQERQELDKK